jgi:G:T-mismatch repair DNA endonuclease (very short patch repair protein)
MITRWSTDAALKQQRSTEMKERWKNPAFRTMMLQKIKNNERNPEFRKNRLAAIDKNWADPEFRKKHATASSRAGKLNMALNWADPEFRKKQSERMKKSNPMFRDDIKKQAHSARAITVKGRDIWKGKKNPMHNPITRAKIIKTLNTDKVRKKISESKLGDLNPMKRPDIAKKVSDTSKRRIASGEIVTHLQKKKKEGDDKFWSKFIKSSAIARTIKPSSIEKTLTAIIDKIAPAFKYNGNFSIMIGRKNPDWIDTKNKKIIELFGCYTHGCDIHFPASKHRKFQSNTYAEMDKVNYFASYGYKTLIIWEHELSNIDKAKIKIKEFSK